MVADLRVRFRLNIIVGFMMIKTKGDELGKV